MVAMVRFFPWKIPTREVREIMMAEHELRRILIEGSDGKLAGIVSLGDLALATEERKLAGEVLRTISS